MALGKSQNKMLFLLNDGSLATGQGTTGKTSEFQVVIEPMTCVICQSGALTIEL